MTEIEISPPEGVNGMLEDVIDPRDFILEWDVGLPTLIEQDTVRFQYDQTTIPSHNSDCTLYSSFWAISDLFNYKLTPQDIEDIRTIAHTRWKVDWQWWDRLAAVKVVADWRNTKNPTNKVIFFKFDMRDTKKRQEVLKKGYTIVSWIIYWLDYIKDKYDDGVIESKKFTDRTWWHAIDNIRNNGDAVKDSMTSRKYNIYNVQYLDDLLESGTFKDTSYLYVKENDMKSKLDQTKKFNEMIVVLKQAIETNSKLRNLSSDLDFKDQLNIMNIVNRGKISYIQKQI